MPLSPLSEFPFSRHRWGLWAFGVAAQEESSGAEEGQGQEAGGSGGEGVGNDPYAMYATARLPNGMTMQVPMSPSLSASSVPAELSKDPEFAYVQKQHWMEKARVSQMIQGLQYEASLRARDVAVANMAVHAAEQRLEAAQRASHAVHSRLAAAHRQLAALDVAQRRAIDQAQLRRLQASLAEAEASAEALTGAQAGHASLVRALEASVNATTGRIRSASAAIDKIMEPLEAGGGDGFGGYSEGPFSEQGLTAALQEQHRHSARRGQSLAGFHSELAKQMPDSYRLALEAHRNVLG